MFSDGGLVSNEIEKLHEAQLRELETIKANDKLNTTPKIPASDLPEKFRQPTESHSGQLEQSARKRTFKDPQITKQNAAAEVIKFYQKTRPDTTAKLMANILDIFDQDKVEREGLSEEAKQWLERFNKTLADANETMLFGPQANTCIVTEDKKSCSIPTMQGGQPCYCNAAPGKQGVSVYRAMGNVCVTPKSWCELNSVARIGTRCWCSNQYNIKEDGSIAR